MPKDFITLHSAADINGESEESEGDVCIDDISSYFPNTADPNRGSVIITKASSNILPVRESPARIRQLLKEAQNES